MCKPGRLAGRRSLALCKGDSASELHRLGTHHRPFAKRHLPRQPSSPRGCNKHRRTAAWSAAALAGSAESAPAGRASSYEGFTSRCVAFSTLPFLFLFLPQLLKNAASLAAGQPEALRVLSYLSYLTGLLGNTLLLSYFTTKREHGAVLVQALGIASSFAVLTQIRIAGFVPRGVYSGVALLVATTATVTALKLGGRLDGSKRGQRLWAGWQKVLGLAGLVLVPQVLASTLAGTVSLAPAACTAVVGAAALALDAAGRLPPALQAVWGGLSAYTATMLFALQPVAQLLNNFQDPSSLAGLSLATIQLASAGNALMVPRALFTRDWVWLVGSLWGSLVFGWAQMLSMWLGTSPAGARYLATPLFAGATLLLWGWYAGIFTADARAKRAAAAGAATAAPAPQ